MFVLTEAGQPVDMGQVGFRLLFVMGIVVAALVSAGTADASTCASRLLMDWRDGRIDATYPVACYRDALATMPEDVRVYSSAEDDITRALQARLGKHAKASAMPAVKKDGDGTTSSLLIVAITAGVLLAAGSVAASLR
jgi:hypothetical protein